MLIRPTGDRADDGSVCLHFTLPVAAGRSGSEAALRIAGQMGLKDAKIAHVRVLDQSHSHYMLYGRTEAAVDISDPILQAEPASLPTRGDLSRKLASIFVDRKVKVVAAVCGSDAHTVGLDAILAAKGVKGEPGLESYPGFHIIKLGRQIEAKDLAAAVREHDADVILISQTVSQQGLHRIILDEVMDALNDMQMRSGRLVICGGADITSALGTEFGYDGAFGRGSSARDIVNFILDNRDAFINRGNGK